MKRGLVATSSNARKGTDKTMRADQPRMPTGISRKGTIDKSLAARGQSDLTNRGARRKEALLEAALRIIVRDGPGAVTLRSVVAEADASHGSVVYYFGTREDLIRDALALVANRNIEALAVSWAGFERQAMNLRKLAQLIARHSVAQMIEDRQMGITIIEFHLAAARYPELSSTLREWGRAYARISHDTFVRIGAVNPEAESALLTNLINGLILKQLALRRSDFETVLLRPAIERFLFSIETDRKDGRS
jgi:DNA-binding transcriptional regulator YbjK